MNTTSTTGPAARVPDVPAVTYADEERVAAFVAVHNLGDWVDLSVRLARDAFPGAKGIVLLMSGEPGEYGERVRLEVATAAEHEERMRQYNDFIARWIDATPPWVTDLMGISLSYL